MCCSFKCQLQLAAVRPYKEKWRNVQFVQKVLHRNIRKRKNKGDLASAQSATYWHINIITLVFPRDREISRDKNNYFGHNRVELKQKFSKKYNFSPHGRQVLRIL